VSPEDGHQNMIKGFKPKGLAISEADQSGRFFSLKEVFINKPYFKKLKEG
jgi:hypothetical protein